MRQTGKTFIVKKFANENYNNVVYINFKVDLNMKKTFESDLNVSQIVSNLSILNSRFKFIPNETVIIFDEIQECSGARASIKPFMEDGRYDIIATGSLLGIKGYNKNYHGGVSAMLKYFKEYICVGGMPAVVDVFLKTNDYKMVRSEQRDILEGYKDDFAKHLNEDEEEVIDRTLLMKINKVYSSILNQLSKENKKFVYSMLETK